MANRFQKTLRGAIPLLLVATLPLLLLAAGCGGGDNQFHDEDGMIMTLDIPDGSILSVSSNVDDPCHNIIDIEVETERPASGTFAGPGAPSDSFFDVVLDEIVVTWRHPLEDETPGFNVPPMLFDPIGGTVDENETLTIERYSLVPCSLKNTSPLNGAGAGLPSSELVANIRVQGHMFVDPDVDVVGTMQMGVGFFAGGVTPDFDMDGCPDVDEEICVLCIPCG